MAFPDKYYNAVAYTESKVGNLEESQLLSNEQKLILYALHQQAEHGPCNLPAPYFWDVTARYKHGAWAQLANMSKVEAMVYYVRELAKIFPRWLEEFDAGVSGGGGVAADADATPQEAQGGGEPRKRRKPRRKSGSNNKNDKKPVSFEDGLSHDMTKENVEKLLREVVSLRARLYEHEIENKKRSDSGADEDSSSDSGNSSEGDPGVFPSPPEVPPVPHHHHHHHANQGNHDDSDELISVGQQQQKNNELGGRADSASSNNRIDGSAYYRQRRVGWLEWFGVTAPVEDSDTEKPARREKTATSAATAAAGEETTKKSDDGRTTVAPATTSANNNNNNNNRGNSGVIEI